MSEFNINFNLKTTAIFQATWWGRRLIFRTARFFKFLFFIFCLGCLAALLFSILELDFSGFILKAIMAGAILSFVFFLFFLEVDSFFKIKIKQPSLKAPLQEALKQEGKYNLASFLDYEMAGVFRAVLRFQKQKGLTCFTNRVLLYFLLKSKHKEVDFVLARIDLSKKKLIRNLEKDFASDNFGQEQGFERVIIGAVESAQQKGKARVGVGDILTGLAENDSFLQKVLLDVDIGEKDIAGLTVWFERSREAMVQQKRFWDYENLLAKGSLARDWAAGYTVTLDKYSSDLRKRIEKGGLRKIVGHQREIAQVERILARDQLNNALLVGEAGLGRRSIVLAVSQKAFLGKSLEPLNYKRTLEIDIGGLISRIPSMEQVEAVLERCFEEAALAGNAILVIDNLHNFIQDTPKPGTVDISGILARYLELPNFQVLALTTFEGLHRILERRSFVANLFEKVEVAEISAEETMEFLEGFVPFLEKKYKKFITFQALRDVVRLSGLYLPNVPFPKKALETLDEVMVYLTQGINGSVLRPSHVAEVITEKTQIPVGKIELGEREMLLNLENLLHQRIINQDEAVKEVAAALRRARAAVKTRKGPIGNFLFLGPTGVGKTETAKALAHFYFGGGNTPQLAAGMKAAKRTCPTFVGRSRLRSAKAEGIPAPWGGVVHFGGEQRMIRLDMSEFQNTTDIERLIGREDGKIGLLTTPVREDPFSLVLLDEIEKAHPNILNLFLQVLDEGEMTDGWGRRVSFHQAIIIATSNAGKEIIRQDILQNKKMSLIKSDLINKVLEKNIFSPEFVNRFDAVVVFKPLTKDNLLDIARLMLGRLAAVLQEKGIDFVAGNGLEQRIVALSYSPEFGAREMRRVLQDKVENVLAEAILSGKIKKGNKIKVDENFNLEILS